MIDCGCMGGLRVLLACNSDLMVIESVFAVHAVEAVLAIRSLLSSWPNFNRIEQSLLNSATKCSSGQNLPSVEFGFVFLPLFVVYAL